MAWLRVSPTTSLVVLLAIHPGLAGAREQAAHEQPADLVVTLATDSTGETPALVVPLPPSAHRRLPRHVIRQPKPRTPRRAVAGWVHPLLREWMSDPSRARERAQLVVVFPDALVFPSFPVPVAPQVDRLRAKEETGSLIASIRAQRAERYVADSLALAVRGVAVLDDAWLIRAMLIEAEIGELPLAFILDSLGALSVQPRYAEEAPPGPRNASLGDNPEVGRRHIRSDPWRFIPQAGDVALLDSGVLSSHELLMTAPPAIAHWWNCTQPAGGCVPAPSPPTPASNPCFEHGTAAAALLSGEDQGGTAFDGVTRARLGVFVVYTPSVGCPATPSQLDTWAALCAIEEARATNHAIVAAEIACPTGPTGPTDRYHAIAAAADRVFETGTLVIAAAGNVIGGTGKIASPGAARRAIAVGAYLMNETPLWRSTGPTVDGRTKPEVTGPTDAETASSGGVADYANFGGTSGATAFVTGAATLLRNRLVQAAASWGGAVDPGQVCAALVVSGQRPSQEASNGSWSFDPKVGAGKVVLPGPHDRLLFGKIEISATADVCFVPIPIVGCTASALDAALWWPETGTHNNIDLEIVSPLKHWHLPVPQTPREFEPLPQRPCLSFGGDGRVMAASRVVPDVFERATAKDPASRALLKDGMWWLRIIGNQVTAGPQTVYWAAVVR